LEGSYTNNGAEKVIDKKDHKDVNRTSPCNDVTKQWLNLDGSGRGVIRYRTKADTRDASLVAVCITHTTVVGRRCEG